MKIWRVNKRYESWEERKYFRDKIVSWENVNASADSLELMSERDRITDMSIHKKWYVQRIPWNCHLKSDAICSAMNAGKMSKAV